MFSTDFIFRQEENFVMIHPCYQLEMSGWIQTTMQQNTIFFQALKNCSSDPDTLLDIIGKTSFRKYVISKNSITYS